MLISRRLALPISIALLPFVIFAAVILAAVDQDERADVVRMAIWGSQQSRAAVGLEVSRQVATLEALTMTQCAEGLAPSLIEANLAKVMAAHTDWLQLTRSERGGHRVILPQSAAPLAASATNQVSAASRIGNVVRDGLHAPYYVIETTMADSGCGISAAIRAWSLKPPLGDVGLPKGWRIMVIDAAGIVVAHTLATHEGDPRIGSPPSPSVAAGSAEPPGTLFEAVSRDGTEVVGVATTDRVPGWKVVVCAPRQMVEEPRRRTLAGVTAGGALALVLAGLLVTKIFREEDQRRQLERRLATADERAAADRRLEAIAANFPGVIYRRVLRPDGTITYPYVSGGCRHLCPLPCRSDRDDRAYLTQSLLPEDQAHWHEALSKSVQNGEPFFYEGRVVCPDGSVRWVRSAANLHQENDCLVWDGVLLDISDRKQAEDDLRKAKEQAEEANAAKARFLAAASHDLRQPVQSLMLFASALTARLRGHPSADIANRIQATVYAMHRLLDSLLDLSRMEAGTVQPRIEDFPIARLLEAFGEEYRPRAAEKGLAFKVVGSSASIRSDPTLIERILRNLIENAMRYTSRGGVLLGCRHHQGKLRIQVVDTGPGIAEEHRQRIFEEFFRGDTTGGGAGLGLATIRRIAGLLGHEVSFRTEVGRGSAFSLDVPLAPAGAPSAVDPARMNG